MSKKHDNAEVTVNCVCCPGCGALIYSMSVHHYHTCPCGLVMVDGGFDYLRFGWGECKSAERYSARMGLPKTLRILLSP